METNEVKSYSRIDFMAILLSVWNNLTLILLTCVLCTLAVYAYLTANNVLLYSSSTDIYVLTERNSNTSNNSSSASSLYADLNLSKVIISDVENIITNVTITEKIVTKLGLDMSPGEVASKISVNVKEDTRILQLTVTDTDPFRATKIANTLRDAASERIVEIMNLEALNTISPARIPTSPADPGISRKAFMVFIAVFAIFVAAIAMLELFSDTVKSPTDIEKHLGIGTLGSIPFTKEDGKNYSLHIKKRG